MLASSSFYYKKDSVAELCATGWFRSTEGLNLSYLVCDHLIGSIELKVNRRAEVNG